MKKEPANMNRVWRTNLSVSFICGIIVLATVVFWAHNDRIRPLLVAGIELMSSINFLFGLTV